MRILLVDGYNVLRSSGAYSYLTERGPDYTDDAFNAAREALVGDVATFAGREFEATVVFDGGGNPYSTGEPQMISGVRVLFSQAGVTADSVIEKLARSAVAKGSEVLVVTSDAATQWTVLGKKVTRMSAMGFTREVQSVQRSGDEVARAQAGRRTLAERLDGGVRESLERMARGQEP
jgi:predicted RNA-binding protein with PIN domain